MGSSNFEEEYYIRSVGMKTRQNGKGGAWGAIMTTLLCAMIFIGCEWNGDTVLKIAELDATVKAQIKYDWEQEFGFPLESVNYYGTHGEFVAFYMFGPDTVVVNYKLAGTIFRHNHDNTIYVWKDGNFFEMIDAFQQGLLTPENIAAIGYHHMNVIRQSWTGEGTFKAWYLNTSDVSIVIVGDFSLTISVENTTLRQGQDIEVTAVFKNQSGKRHKISRPTNMMVPIVIGSEHYQGASILPALPPSILEIDEVTTATWPIGSMLPKGEHILVARFGFDLLETGAERIVPAQPILVESNQIILTVY